MLTKAVGINASAEEKRMIGIESKEQSHEDEKKQTASDFAELFYWKHVVQCGWHSYQEWSQLRTESWWRIQARKLGG